MRDRVIQDCYVLNLQLEAKDEDATCIKKSVVFKYRDESTSSCWQAMVIGTRAFIPPACGVYRVALKFDRAIGIRWLLRGRIKVQTLALHLECKVARAFVNGRRGGERCFMKRQVSFGREINPHYRQPSLDVARARVAILFSLRGVIADAEHQFARRRRGANCRRARYTRRAQEELQRALGGDGESRSVTFDPHQCAAPRRSPPRGASSGSQTRGWPTKQWKRNLTDRISL